MLSRRVTDVSELSSGTPMGQRLRLKLGLERGKGLRECDRDKGFRGEGAEDGGIGSGL